MIKIDLTNSNRFAEFDGVLRELMAEFAFGVLALKRAVEKREGEAAAEKMLQSFIEGFEDKELIEKASEILEKSEMKK